MIIEWMARFFGRNGREEAETPTGRRPLHGAQPGGDRALTAVVDPPHMLRVELERARRYEHDLAIVVLSTTLQPEPEVTGNGNGNGGGGSPSRRAEGPPQVVSLLAAAALREALRESDIVCFQPTENRFVVTLGKAGEKEAGRALTRIESILRERLNLGARAGVARFPSDAVTLDHLVQTAARRMSGHRGPSTASAAKNGNGKAPTAATRAGRAGRPAHTANGVVNDG